LNVTRLCLGGAEYGGVAFGAKIAFLDLANSPDEGVSVPDVDQTYGPGYQAGARVHTNSWGSPFSTGDYYDVSDVDQYLYDHPVSCGP
jgi:serine protease AprX